MGRKIRWGVPATGGIAASFTRDLLEPAYDAEVVGTVPRWR
ncbi:hypothetical protein [Streptomyces sp. TRM49041]|nr:hypothetical protein [Streptomyces sp. TRM49041]